MADFRSGVGNGQDKLRVSCAGKQENCQRLLGKSCKKYTGDKDKLIIKKNIDCNGLKQIH